MDHWGDPWADAAHDAKSSTKDEVTTPPAPPTADTHAPIVPNHFLDDAGWGGDDDEGFGGWAPSPRKPDTTASETRVNGFESETNWDDLDDTNEGQLNDDAQNERNSLRKSNEWSRIEEDVQEPHEPQEPDNETSDSATTIQQDDTPARVVVESLDALHPDDDLSTRPSTSPSDISHNGATIESPRTSFEDERAAEKTQPLDQHLHNDGEHASETKMDEHQPELESDGEEQADDDFGDFEDNVEQDVAESQLQAESTQQASPESACEAAKPETSTPEHSAQESPKIALTHVGLYSLDSDLLTRLFPLTKDTKELEETPGDPVHSTSSRKAWYRLTRKQTMREYDSGNYTDDYIRVTWKTSHIRSEVNKVVLHWANEDRLAGRGPGAKASFYWDSPAPANQKAPAHAHKKSTISVSNPIRPVGQSVQPLATNVPAAFNWSSPSTSHDPWKDDAEEIRSVSSPVAAPKHHAVAKLQRQAVRGSSVDLTPRPNQPVVHKRTATAIGVLSEELAAPSFSPIELPKPQTSEDTDPWADLEALDTSPPLEAGTANPEGNDDDWGEMVESPAMSTIQSPSAEIPDLSTRNNTLSTPSTTPKSVRSSPLQAHATPSGSKHASPIVRLKGAVSPTSARFKPNAFVPAGVEEGPIGPGVLRPRNRSLEPTSERATSPPQAIAQLDEVLTSDLPKAAAVGEATHEWGSETLQPERAGASEAEDDFAAFEDPIPIDKHEQPRTSTPPPPQQPASPWGAEADFSIFESSLPTTATSTHASHQQQADPLDPWSIFDSPAATLPSGATEELSSSINTRSPLRLMTPPPKQALTGATNSLQRRKAEEDEMIRSIVDDLPDLSYMLKQ